MKISQQKQQTLRQDMPDSHINLEPQFFETHHHHELPALPSHQDYPHPLRNYQPMNNNTHSSSNEGELTTHANFNKFYEEFKRIFSVSYNLQIEKDRLRNVVQQLQDRIHQVQDKLSAQNASKSRDPKGAVLVKRQQNSEQNRNRRARRTAQEIEKKYKCEVAFCERFYGSEGSLQQHIKLKHPELLSKDSEEYVPGDNKGALSE